MKGKLPNNQEQLCLLSGFLIFLFKVEERAAEFYSMLIFKEVSSKHSGAYTCVANNAAARANYTAHLMVKGEKCCFNCHFELAVNIPLQLLHNGWWNLKTFPHS